MLTKVGTGILRLQVPMPFNMGAVNSYFVEGQSGYTVVDTGDNTMEAREVWKKVLAMDIPIEKIVVTHAHPDHLGLAAWFQNEYGLPVWLSEEGHKELVRARQMFMDDYEDVMIPFALQHGAALYPPADDRSKQYYKPDTFQFEPDVLFKMGDDIRLGDAAFQVIWTPGHSEDHCCFYDQDSKIMFAGDHILKNMNPIVTSRHMEDNPLQEYMESLDKIESCQTELVLPGHGELFENLAGRIAEMKSHYVKRWLQTYEAIGSEGKTAYDASRIVYSNYTERRVMPAFLQTITNLIYLESKGAVRWEKRDGKIFYFQVPSFREALSSATV
ncbi:MBL fold metallo-hydrolase [Sporosarcina sp. 179-K 3D1 HS]|uniref:MBL fold metallo-hydrolase n=1 Tax=Sporosarcina sp. 179-K 3D1 HS TaxID=3232169 RepID=UPI00399F0C15